MHCAAVGAVFPVQTPVSVMTLHQAEEWALCYCCLCAVLYAMDGAAAGLIDVSRTGVLSIAGNATVESHL